VRLLVGHGLEGARLRGEAARKVGG
jgi:hypothetical protein